MDIAGMSDPPGLKSPIRGFLYSLAVPGLGQYYYGGKIKPLVFLSAEIASWALYFRWHGDGDDLTQDFEHFNQEHWKRTDYETYLLWVYGETDDSKIDEPEISHQLPETRTQQYYEMTGKYDQFAWGWDDAILDGNDLNDYDSASPPPPIDRAANAPYSERRFEYEQMRDDANRRYDRATRMVFVSLTNHLISAFEAFFAIKSRNNKIEKTRWAGGRVRVRARLKSYHSQWDTPFMTVAYKF